VASGKILSIDYSGAEKAPGVVCVITYKDIPGENQIGGIIPDEPLLAETEVHYIGQPVAVVIAESQLAARKALRHIKLDIEKFDPIFDPRKAFQNGRLIIPPRTFSIGDTESTWSKCDIIVEGRVDSGSQEHVYLETQGAVSIPGEKLKIISSTQSPSVVQRTVAKVLGISMNEVEVDVLRLGGGFGGKEDQATSWACIVALAAQILKRPVKLILQRSEDMRMTGKRHPYSSDFKIGMNKNGKILAYEVTFYQNAGAAADLSPAILERTLFHSTNSYYIPNVRATAISCKTNLPPFTAFRGFGGPQAMFVLEGAIYKAAEVLNLDPMVIQRKNLLKEGDQFPYGMKVSNCQAEKCWNEMIKRYDIDKAKNEIEKFNTINKSLKKGISIMPICFGISFTNTLLNQASALVHVYTDGSIGVSTAAIEMGQGVNMKILQTAAYVFGVPLDRVRIESTNTTRIANTSPTAASSAADLNGKATQIACENILQRLNTYIAGKIGNISPNDIEIKDEMVYSKGIKTDVSWEKLISGAYQNRINLSAHAHYSTPEIYFDRSIEKGVPFAYHVFGSAITEITLDCLRGTFEIDSVKVVHDFGQSINPIIDRSQTEGGIVQGIGWMTLEEIIYNNDGKLLTDSLTTYKVPDIHFSPKEIQICFLENAENPMGLMNSKAIGEPPLMYGIGIYFALMNAMKQFRPDLKMNFCAPLTNEKILLNLYNKK
jgi:xanthine dehydrogenase large subunit